MQGSSHALPEGFSHQDIYKPLPEGFSSAVVLLWTGTLSQLQPPASILVFSTHFSCWICKARSFLQQTGQMPTEVKMIATMFSMPG